MDLSVTSCTGTTLEGRMLLTGLGLIKSWFKNTSHRKVQSLASCWGGKGYPLLIELFRDWCFWTHSLPGWVLAGILWSASSNVGSCLIFVLPHTPARYFKDEVGADHRADAVFLDGWVLELLLSLSKVMMGKPSCWVQVSIMAATSTLPLIAPLSAFQRSLLKQSVLPYHIVGSFSHLVTVLPYLCLFMYAFRPLRRTFSPTSCSNIRMMDAPYNSTTWLEILACLWLT